MAEIESRTTKEIRSESKSNALVDRLSKLHTKVGIYSIVKNSMLSIALYLLFLYLFMQILPKYHNTWADNPMVIFAVPLLAIAALRLAAYLFDKWRKGIAIKFSPDETSKKVIDVLNQALSEMRSCNKIWHIQASHEISNRKYSGGAHESLTRSEIQPAFKGPEFVKFSITPFHLNAGQQDLYFLPDRVLIYDKYGVADVPYGDLQIISGQTRFIESGKVPRDATVVDRTWSRVNKDGGPDRRYKDNKEIPVCLYDELSLRSASGLNEQFQLSKAGAGDKVRTVLASIPSLFTTKEVV
jgi:hypothetical protein